MEHRLILMRHARSEWQDPGQTDHSRPLTPDGRLAAESIAHSIAKLGWSPDHIACSDARRTRETADCMAPLFPTPPSINQHHTLYSHGRDTLWEVAATWSPSLTTILVLGHNPDMQLLISDLCGRSIQMTTATAALLFARKTGNWAELLLHPTGAWEMVKILRPPVITP